MKQGLQSLFTVLVMAGMPQLLMAQDRDSADEIIAAGLSALQKIDRAQSDPRQVDSLWDNASVFIKTKMAKEEFLNGIRQSRARYGAVGLRTWAGVMRIRYDKDADVPQGLYANADFSTRLPNGNMIFEKVSFRLEPDGWKMVGYVPRESQ